MRVDYPYAIVVIKRDGSCWFSPCLLNGSSNAIDFLIPCPQCLSVPLESCWTATNESLYNHADFANGALFLSGLWWGALMEFSCVILLLWHGHFPRQATQDLILLEVFCSDLINLLLMMVTLGFHDNTSNDPNSSLDWSMILGLWTCTEWGFSPFARRGYLSLHYDYFINNFLYDYSKIT